MKPLIGLLLLLWLGISFPAYGYLICEADFGSAGGQNSTFDLAAKSLLVRADGGAGTENSSDATIGYELDALSTMDVDLEVGITYSGVLVGNLGINTIYGDINVTAFVRDETDGVEIDQQVLLDQKEGGVIGGKITNLVSSNLLGPPTVIFEKVPMQAGHTYSVSVRAIAKAKGLAGEADFKDDFSSIDIGCVTATANDVDSDGDGLFDAWEIDGVDTDFDGVADIQLPSMGATWDHKDLFLELDWRTGMEPTRDAISAVKQAFALAPADAGGVMNPDLTDGINLWIDTGGLMEDGALVGDDFGGGNEIVETVICLDDSFYDAKAMYYDPDRRPIFRYGIFGDPAENECANGSTPGGKAELGGNDLISYLPDPSILMHELGHNLNLDHGGFESLNRKPNYISVMNYNHQLGITRSSGPDLVDYSPPRCPTCPTGRGTIPMDLDETNLDESEVLDADDLFNLFKFYDAGRIFQSWAMQGQDTDQDGGLDIDWDGDGSINSSVGVDINGDGVCVSSGSDGVLDTIADGNDILLGDGRIYDGPDFQCDTTADPMSDDEQEREPGEEQTTILQGHDDWSVIEMPPLGHGDSADAALNLPEQPELSIEEMLADAREAEETDLEIIKTAPAVVDAGIPFVYNLQVTNLGPRRARRIEVIDFLPLEVTVLALPEGCFEPGTEGKVICHPNSLLPGESHDLKIKVVIPPAVVAALPAPVRVENFAKVENRVPLGLKGSLGIANDDPDTSNNSDSVWSVVNRPPVAVAGLPYAVECQGATSDLQLDSTGTVDPDGDPLTYQWTTNCASGVFDDASSPSAKLNLESVAPLPKVCPVSLEVTDPRGLADSDTTPVTVDDTTQPNLQVILHPKTLSPADHLLKEITATVVATDACTASPTISLATIFSDEPDDAPGPADGNTTGDIAEASLGIADFEFKLRAERLEGGDGRQYTVVYTAMDEKGLLKSAIRRVVVPH